MSVSGAEKVIVKLGGEVVASPQLAVICAGVARLVAAGVQVIIVHGGGPQVSALQERLQIPVRKVAGRRYTDEDTLRVLKMAVAGGVNVDLCAGLRAAMCWSVSVAVSASQIFTTSSTTTRPCQKAPPRSVSRF